MIFWTVRKIMENDKTAEAYFKSILENQNGNTLNLMRVISMLFPKQTKQWHVEFHPLCHKHLIMTPYLWIKCCLCINKKTFKNWNNLQSTTSTPTIDLFNFTLVPKAASTHLSMKMHYLIKGNQRNTNTNEIFCRKKYT